MEFGIRCGQFRYATQGHPIQFGPNGRRGLQMDRLLKTGERVGEARNRTLALVEAIKAIDKNERQIRASVRKAKQEQE